MYSPVTNQKLNSKIEFFYINVVISRTMTSNSIPLSIVQTFFYLLFQENVYSSIEISDTVTSHYSESWKDFAWKSGINMFPSDALQSDLHSTYLYDALGEPRRTALHLADDSESSSGKMRFCQRPSHGWRDVWIEFAQNWHE